MRRISPMASRHSGGMSSIPSPASVVVVVAVVVLVVVTAVVVVGGAIVVVVSPPDVMVVSAVVAPPQAAITTTTTTRATIRARPVLIWSPPRNDSEGGETRQERLAAALLSPRQRPDTPGCVPPGRRS